VTSVPWSHVLSVADMVARHLPPPANVVGSIAVAIGRAIVESGCSVDGCPADVEARLVAPHAPDLLAQSLKNRTDLARRATGTDRAAIDAAFSSDADELLGDPRAR
jgi:hypothetical protein